jgi:hypothetical protein
MDKKPSTANVKPKTGGKVDAIVSLRTEGQVRSIKNEVPTTGLAGIAGGLEGSEELADLLSTSTRHGGRSFAELKSKKRLNR